MIQRIVIQLILVIVLSDLYIDIHYFRRHYHITWWQRLLWWLPCIGMVVYTCALASIRNFAPADLTWLNIYLVLVGLFVGPKAIFTVSSSVGWVVRKFITRTHRNWGHYVGLALGLVAVCLYVYGLTIGVGQIRVKRIDLSFADLPPSFDGFRLVHVSDVHLGTFDGWRKRILKAEMDSLYAQHPDIICFTGDLQNMRPEEVLKLKSVIDTTMRGAFSVLGNHDYAEYVKDDAAAKVAMERRLASYERDSLHWTLLDNEHVALYRQPSGGMTTAPRQDTRTPADSIILCGVANDGRPPFPQKADMRKAMSGISENDFVIMLQHDPTAWRRNILPKTHVQLTLSGHTHGGQMQVFGWRPTQLTQREDFGLFEHAGRYLYVTAGLGGLVPFRLNMPNEIAVITLHRRQ